MINRAVLAELVSWQRARQWTLVVLSAGTRWSSGLTSDVHH